jgi:twitching motility protein PilT
VDEIEDLNRLIAELNDGNPPADRALSVEAAPSDGRLERWLTELVSSGGSDLLLVAGSPPALRRDGRLEPLSEGPLGSGDIEDSMLAWCPAPARRHYVEGKSADFSLRARGRRFRANLHRERGHAAAAIRALPAEPPKLSALGLPEEVRRLAGITNGLVLVAGPTGSGKTTTLAALLDEINRKEARHIITIEDPIEYEHPHRRSIVEQVEVGSDTPGFAQALRAALRQAPDVIAVGELRDAESMALALSAAETGHVVFATIHAADAAGAVARLADSFPAERQPTIRQEIAMALAAIVTQHLLPRADGRGVAAAAELFFVTPAARQHIRKNALQHLHQELTISRSKTGAVALEESLARIARSGVVAAEEARARATFPEEFDSLLSRPAG